MLFTMNSKFQNPKSTSLQQGNSDELANIFHVELCTLNFELS